MSSALRVIYKRPTLALKELPCGRVNETGADGNKIQAYYVDTSTGAVQLKQRGAPLVERVQEEHEACLGDRKDLGLAVMQVTRGQRGWKDAEGPQKPAQGTEGQFCLKTDTVRGTGN